ncbi:hypothetical protein SynBMKMC1_01644 [Synechococcus sp. BMK-MC-1]|nr:hypothetical protein SynBMKMC1_01644 [Synechococcus sp. BMK-MC-1]
MWPPKLITSLSSHHCASAGLPLLTVLGRAFTMSISRAEIR